MSILYIVSILYIFFFQKTNKQKKMIWRDKNKLF